MVNLTILGTGGSMPTPHRNLAAALLNYKGRKILIDCGEGTQISMKIARTGFKDIDIICITHWHGDHIIGLLGILSTIGNSGRVKPMTIIGPVGIIEVIKALRVIVPYLPYEINIIEHRNEALKFILIKENLVPSSDKGDIEIETLNLEHSTPCIGYKFNIKRRAKFNVNKALENKVPKNLWNVLQTGNDVELNGEVYTPSMVLGENRKGIIITYITDTLPIEGIIPFANNSDIFICEGTYGDDRDVDKALKNKHMTFSQAATLAKKANVKKLILTHFSTAMENPEDFIHFAKDIFKETYVAKDRMVESINFNE